MVAFTPVLGHLGIHKRVLTGHRNNCNVRTGLKYLNDPLNTPYPVKDIFFEMLTTIDQHWIYRYELEFKRNQSMEWGHQTSLNKNQL